MKKRDCLLSSAFVGPPLMLAGKELVLTFARMQVLQVLDNVIFGNDSQRKQSEIEAVHECAWIMSLSREELMRAATAGDDANKSAMLRFVIENEDEIDEIRQGIVNRLNALKAATFHPDTPGKEEARHAS